jgi:hypothetical protein
MGAEYWLSDLRSSMWATCPGSDSGHSSPRIFARHLLISFSFPVAHEDFLSGLLLHLKSYMLGIFFGGAMQFCCTNVSNLNQK